MQSRLANIFSTAAVPGRSALLDVCVAFSDEEQHEAQAAFDRKLSHYRDEISELRDQGIHHRPLICTADGRPHTAVTRTLQYDADIASSRNGQQMSAKSLQCWWKHEIPIALARAEWLLARVIDRALHHWGHVLPPDGGLGDHDNAYSETDTATPDDDDDIASLASQSFASMRPSTFHLPASALGQCASALR